MKHFKPNITPTTKAVWEFAGVLHPLLRPEAGLSWDAYLRSGGVFYGGRPPAR